MSAPREIWLQTEDNPASTDAFKVVSWCESALNSTAVPYILKSDYDELQAKLDKIYTTEPVAFMTIDKAPYLYRDANPISSDYPIEKLIIKPTKEPA